MVTFLRNFIFYLSKFLFGNTEYHSTPAVPGGLTIFTLPDGNTVKVKAYRMTRWRKGGRPEVFTHYFFDVISKLTYLYSDGDKEFRVTRFPVTSDLKDCEFINRYGFPTNYIKEAVESHVRSKGFEVGGSINEAY